MVKNPGKQAIPDQITSTDELDALYGPALPRALIKEIDHLSSHYRAFIEAAPFVVLATSGPDGLDCSPRGDPVAAARVVDSKTIQLPDHRGNNRIDSLRNLVEDPRLSLLFMIPGIGETLRVNGRARILTSAALLASFAVGKKLPRTVLEISIERVYYQCQKALIRARLWDSEVHRARDALPSAGQILESLSTEKFDGAAYDAAYPEHMKKTIY